MAAISTIAALATAAAAVGGAYSAYEQGKDARAMAKKQAAALKPVVEVDPAGERAKAEADAAQAANSKLAAKNKARQASSLLANDQADGLSVLSGKTKLGQ